MKSSNNILKLSAICLALTGAFSSSAFAATPSVITDNGNDGNVAANTIDNDPTFSTRWSANGNDGSQWVRYDFGSATSLSGLNIAFYKGDQRQTYFRIQSSNDGSNWTTQIDASSTGSSGSTTGLENYSFNDNVSARYFRIQGFGNSSNTWNSLTDVEFIDGGEPVIRTSVPGLIQAEDYNAAYDTTAGNTGGQYRADDVDVQTTNDTDGGYNVGWIKSGEWLEYPISVTSAGTYTADIRVASSRSTGTFDVLVDGNTKANVEVGHTGGWQSWTTQTVNLGTLSAGNHTIRINVTGSDFNLNWVELKKESGPITGTGFDWDGWKVTMPVNGDTFYGDGNTSSAAEIQPAGCTDATFDEDLANEYFWSDSEGLHFKVPMNLDGKTPNTSYIRSELRELHDWSPCGTTSEANWAFGGNHTLNATIRIDDYNRDTAKVVVGQIHGHDVSYATIKLHWEGDSKPIRVIYNTTPATSSSESVNLGYVDSSGFWDYSIKMTDTGIELSAGGVTETLTFGNELNNAWKDETFYFKAGLYPQQKPDASSTVIYEATFSNVEVIHD
ncbi:polysaccharide lyase family 7 protein [Algibacillus agarilyticus]|uniref:polysaccharide lyase family 7 protein n=1 Tax=Algibacillus agarilyticus TaxID=2234133 RepID=UPI0018E54B46|nr:polysaccharide lyase family 7 protein [Algibacillus agarilyticus]